MPSAYTEHGLTLQEPGENENTWGDILNDNVIELIDDGIFGRAAFALSGLKTLTNTNGVANEARCAILHVTGGIGGTITIPTLSKLYMVINDASGDVIVSAGAASATVVPTERNMVVCDGSAVAPLGVSSISLKAYIDSLAFDAVDLPGQAGAAGKFLKSNGTSAAWAALAVADLVDYASDQATKAATYAANDAATLVSATAVAAALAIAL